MCPSVRQLLPWRWAWHVPWTPQLLHGPGSLMTTMNWIAITDNALALKNLIPAHPTGNPSGTGFCSLFPATPSQSSNSLQEIPLAATLWMGEDKCVSPVQQGSFLIRNHVLLVRHDFPWMKTHSILFCFALVLILLFYRWSLHSDRMTEMLLH